jgi:hypothetical protein
MRSGLPTSSIRYESDKWWPLTSCNSAWLSEHVVTDLGAQQAERLLEAARRAFDGPIRQLAEHGHAPRREFLDAVRAVAELMITGGHARLVYDDPWWHGAWDLEKASDNELAAWGIRLVFEARAELLR